MFSCCRRILDNVKTLQFIYGVLERGMRVKNQLLKNISLYLIILVVAAMVLRMNMPQEAKPAEWTYSTFIQNLDAGKVDNVNLKSVGNDNYEVIGETKDGKAFTLFAPASDQTLHNQLQEKM